MLQGHGRQVATTCGTTGRGCRIAGTQFFVCPRHPERGLCAQRIPTLARGRLWYSHAAEKMMPHCWEGLTRLLSRQLSGGAFTASGEVQLDARLFLTLWELVPVSGLGQGGHSPWFSEHETSFSAHVSQNQGGPSRARALTCQGARALA